LCGQVPDAREQKVQLIGFVLRCFGFRRHPPASSDDDKCANFDLKLALLFALFYWIHLGLRFGSRCLFFFIRKKHDYLS
jgi:hypothetical protein